MKLPVRFALALVLAASVLSSFARPGLKDLLTAEEWKAAGLDRLTPAEIAVIESALNRPAQPSVATVQPAPSTSATIAQPETSTALVTPVASEHSRAIAISPAPSPAVTSSPAAQTNSTPSAAAITPTSAVASPSPRVESSSEETRSWMSRFGLPAISNTDWRKLPPLQAKVVSWESANRFTLDNGQAWEGTEPIPDELVGRTIEIHARPNNRFTLVLDGKNTKVRVVRVR